MKMCYRWIKTAEYRGIRLGMGGGFGGEKVLADSLMYGRFLGG